MSNYKDVQMGPPIEVFALMKNFADDDFKDKVNLSAGAYRTGEGKPWVLPVVRKAEKKLADDETLNHEYLPILGYERFSKLATTLLLGEDSPAIKEQRAFGIQALSGTGALRIGAEFLNHIMGRKVMAYSNPSWENHNLLFKLSGFTDISQYRYWCPEKRGLDFDGFLADLRKLPEGAVVVLHACAHNPTGCDPTQEQWKILADLIEERKLFPFFDCAYQGFASGDLARDAWVVRYFVNRGFELFCSQSFSKNFGLYNERIGNLTIVTKNIDTIAPIKSQMTILIRGMYSNPPCHGARIVDHVLSDKALFQEWQENIGTMSSRIIEMRKLLRAALEKLNTPGSWEHITNQIGMFSYTGLNEKQSHHMIDKHHIYMLKSGRISMAGVTPGNVEYIAKAIHETITNVPNKL